jgi:hypothetical protein
LPGVYANATCADLIDMEGLASSKSIYGKSCRGEL